MKIDKKPTRKQLLGVISELQHLVGSARGYYGDDRNPMGYEYGRNALDEAFKLCIAARSFDPPSD